MLSTLVWVLHPKETFFSIFSDQNCLNTMRSSRRFRKLITVKVLDHALFPTGQKYFDIGKRMFAGDNPENRTVLVHNNFIIGYENKIYRFKEQLMWYLDTDGYYSNTKAKYVAFENSWFFPNKSQETRALENAFFIGHVLNRIVILPKFFCHICKKKPCPEIPDGPPLCAAHARYRVKDLNNVFGEKYREHVFLKHPLVPNSVRKSLSPFIYFEVDKAHLHPNPEKIPIDKCDGTNLSNCQVHGPFNVSTNPVKTETLKAWLETFSHYSVLRFQHLHGNIVDLDSDPELQKKLADGFAMGMA